MSETTVKMFSCEAIELHEKMMTQLSARILERAEEIAEEEHEVIVSDQNMQRAIND